MCKIIPNKTGYEKFTINMNFDVAIYKTKTHGTSNLQNIEDSSSKLEWNINYNYSADRKKISEKIWCEKSTIITKQIAEICLKILIWKIKYNY